MLDVAPSSPFAVNLLLFEARETDSTISEHFDQVGDGGLFPRGRLGCASIFGCHDKAVDNLGTSDPE